jgi:Protein of unknown function (DUF429)
MSFSTVIGIDFSGAAQAGTNIWIAQAAYHQSRLVLSSLNSLETLSGSADRQPALACLVDFISKQNHALVAIDFPFGLPVELGWTTWDQQLAAVAGWKQGASEFGRECVRRAKLLGEKMHIRRSSDVETKTPFDCYHYRIIYQTFHGMRDVLLPLRSFSNLSILPFSESPKDVVVVEACPGSSLKRWGLPHQNYKQPAGGALTSIRRSTRKTILEFLKTKIAIDVKFERIAMRNPGGDALDAVIACVGSLEGVQSVSHADIYRHERYRHEGRVYC